MMFNTSKWFYNTTMIGIVVSGIACNADPTPMPTEELVTQTVELDPIYQLIYDTQFMKTPDSNQQRVRILLWLSRMNCDVSQLQKLDDLRKIAAEKYVALQEIEQRQAQQAQELYTPLFNQLWDSMRTGADLSDPQIQETVQTFQATAEAQTDSLSLDVRLETIKSILDAEEDFLRSLSPEQESTIVDALYFLRYKLDPIGNPKDFSLLIGNTFEPGQYAILLKGTSELAQQSGNIGGLWSDQPELTGRVLHEAKREVVLYLILLEPALEEAIRAAIALQTQSNAP